jgi:chitinase
LGLGYGVTEIEQIRSQGGDVAISFGGENGTLLESVCGPQGFAKVMEDVEKTYKPAFIDFDVEGANLNNVAANTDRIEALRLFLTAHPSAIIQFTLPANNEGLANNGIAFVQQLLNSTTGLWAYRNNFRYNLMTMAWYSQYSGTVEKSIEDAVTAGSSQLKNVYCSQSSGACTYQAQDFYKMIRVTARIGVDYDGHIMQINEAKTLTDYAKRIGLGGISFWSIDVDQNRNSSVNCGASYAQPDCSGVDQYPFQYTKTFLASIGVS